MNWPQILASLVDPEQNWETEEISAALYARGMCYSLGRETPQQDQKLLSLGYDALCQGAVQPGYETFKGRLYSYLEDLEDPAGMGDQIQDALFELCEELDRGIVRILGLEGLGVDTQQAIEQLSKMSRLLEDPPVFKPKAPECPAAPSLAGSAGRSSDGDGA